MALSPWHVRYSVEARGYSEMIAALVVSWVCLVRAMETRRWRWWIGYAVAQAMVLLGNLAPLWGIVMTNVLLGIYLGWRWRVLRETLPFKRWAVSCSLSVMLLMPFLFPVIPQVLEYEKTGGGRDPGAAMNAEWLRDYASHLVAGVPVAADWLLIMAGVLVVLGLVLVLIRGSWEALLPASGVIIGGVLGFLQLRANSAPAFGWYLLFTLPPVILLIAWSTEWRGKLKRRGGSFRRGVGDRLRSGDLEYTDGSCFRAPTADARGRGGDAWRKPRFQRNRQRDTHWSLRGKRWHASSLRSARASSEGARCTTKADR